MFKTILFIFIPNFIYLGLFSFIEEQKDLILLSLIITTIIYWASNLVPLYFSSLIFLFTALAFSLASKDVIFSGFSSGAFWLVFAGMLIATAIKNTNLTLRFTNLFSNIKNLTYLKLLIYISIFAVLFSFIMPSSVVRIVLVVPLAIALASSLGFQKEDKGFTGIILTFILCTSLPAFTILPANVPNMILAGLTKEIYDYELLFSYYFIANFLVLGFIKNIIIVSLVYYFFKDELKNKLEKEEIQDFTKNEKIVLATIFIMLILWMSDFIHQISPSIIAIIGVLFLAFPTINIIKAKDFNSINFSSLIYVVAIISLGSIVANNDFFENALNSLVNQYEPFDLEILNYISITSFMSFSGIVITQPTIPAIFTPIAQQLSDVSAFSLNEVFMMQIAAFSNVFFPFQAPPLAVGLALSQIKQRDMLKIILLLALITIVFLYPLEYFWLSFLR
ncbi:SLC13 family permease [Arcobacter roscoffensis]|uniref:Anion permease n=1 Tax=Arcobacter roscoffensis TaxID=2961520 RepID=A0ABY5E7U0_9BACT|nr:SLC13 family permease [Arcobacter roscoffensis]UTJ07830.1 anion permease [Arcobacter roscoffensis]